MATPRKEQSTNTENLETLAQACDVNEVLLQIALRWKMQILYCIAEDVSQFSTLKKMFPTLSDQVLSKRLKELKEESLVVTENIENTIPPQIRYSPTEKGKELLKIILDLHHWGLKWKITENDYCQLNVVNTKI
ncbi:helix-turn-helix domain-containing protein [Sphingobacterium sp. 2149]|uniref:winged helix-turn-helix transcriptional regulator n=1 Tax=Sphingobacterium sp. 2149 TaxID=2817763 RepID=UPI001AE71113|nr:helix-turn-helix domain-containing protein [Sphingobacterium sp. 2149]MDR6733541.1 DNA-binding HxlR family transcriptional regulator [Sphingobacterium sp. 2149]